MKIKNLIFFLLIGILLSGLVTAGFISVHDKEGISEQINQNQIQVPESSNVASVSKGTTLLLLAVGVIGVLGVSRRKKDRRSHTQINDIPDIKKDSDLKKDVSGQS
jgi:hypothetical protein